MDSSRKSFNISFGVGLAFTSIGLVLMLAGWADLGMAFFFFLPLAIGISSGMLPDLRAAIWGTLASLGIFSIFLLFTQIEGLICVLMATPILLLAIWVGWWIGGLIRRRKGEESLRFSLAPFLIFVFANLFEIFSGNPHLPSEVKTSIVLDGTPQEVYRQIIQVDTVDVETNLLQDLGLPIPRKCVLTEEKVGGLRLCEFEEGRIVETIKELIPNKYMRMDVTECSLDKERDWLQFDEDIYRIDSLGDHRTRITRTTTYKSTLKPRIYWEIMEALTIESEHDFVFRNLKQDVER